jgi:hypothetical protein
MESSRSVPRAVAGCANLRTNAKNEAGAWQNAPRGECSSRGQLDPTLVHRVSPTKSLHVTNW